MDTYKDAVELNDLWAAGQAPWPTPPADCPSEHTMGASKGQSAVRGVLR